MKSCLGILAFAAMLMCGSSDAPAWEWGGHVKLQAGEGRYAADDLQTALNGGQTFNDQAADVRLKVENQTDQAFQSIHYEFLGLHGDSVTVRQRLLALGLNPSSASALPDDRRNLFDLTHTVTDRSRALAVHRLDRLTAGVRDGASTFRFGRDAVSWGNGLSFHVLDFVNPFSPLAIDKEYKTGADLLLWQQTFKSQRELETLLVPRRDLVSREVESEESTLAARARVRLERSDIDAVLARHYDETVVGFGTSSTVKGGVLRADVSWTDLNNADGVFSGVINADYSWTWFDKNTHGSLEYFRNGVGEKDPADYLSPKAALRERFARGEVYSFARDYTALSLRVELTPLFNLHFHSVFNLNDQSRFTQVRGVYAWLQNSELTVGVNWPSGEHDSEYGGLAVAGSPYYLGVARSAYAKMAYYF
jgi:hypothetical protein